MKNTFLKNIFITSSGALVNVAINIGLTPIISRIYSKEDYGFYALFLAIATTSTIVTTLMYPTAIVIPKSDEESDQIVRLSVFLTLIGTFMLLTALMLINVDELVFQSNNRVLWILLIPFTVLLGSLDKIMTSYNVRQKYFKKNALSAVSKSAVNKPLAIMWAIGLQANVYGLIVGTVLSRVVSVFVKSTQEFWKLSLSKINLVELKLIARKYKDYPRYILPGNFINKFSSDVPLYAFTAFYDASFTGSFAFASTILTIPYNIIGNSISPVFLQKVNELYHEDIQKFQKFTLQTYQKLFHFGLLPFGFLTSFGEEIFTWFFSSEWSQAGLFAGFMSYYFLFRLISSPLAAIYRVAEKEKLSLRINLIILLTRITAIAVGIRFLEPLQTVLLFSILSAGIYIVNSIFIFRIAGINWLRIIVLDIMKIALVVGLFYLIKNSIYEYLL